MAMNRESLRHRPMGRVVCRLAWLTALGFATGLSLPAFASHGGSSGGSRGGGGFHASSGGSRGGSGFHASSGGSRGGSGFHASSGGSRGGSGFHRSSVGSRGGAGLHAPSGAFRSFGASQRGSFSVPHRGTFVRPAARSFGARSFNRPFDRSFNRGFFHHRFGGGWGWWGWPVSSWWWGGPWWGWGWGWGAGWGWDGYPYGTIVYEGSGGHGYDRPRGVWGIVKTDVTPEEAEVWLDGHYIGTADDFDGNPDFLYLKPGKYALEFKLAGYEPLSLDVEIAKAEQLRFDQTLKLEPGKSPLDSFTPPSKGMPSGRFFGPGGQVATPSSPSARSRYAEDEGEGVGIDDRRDRTAIREEPPPRGDRPGREDRPYRETAPRGDRGRLRVRVTPEDAAIYVDDRYVGVGEELNNSRRGVLAEAGKRTVTVSRPGYKTKTVEVEAKAGQPIDVVVDLEKGQ